MTREELEAVIWHERGGDVDGVDRILAAADAYAESIANERIAGRKRLTEAAAEMFERKG